MNCPNCGAAMELREGHGYFACGHCGTIHFPQPMSPDIKVLGVEQQAPPCPACRTPLAAATVAGQACHFCTRCRGILFSRGTFTELVQAKRAWASGTPTEPAPLDRRELDRKSVCPRCSNRMATHPYYGPGNIVIDTCESCDLIWLDAGELDRVVDAPGRDRGSSLRGGEGGWPGPGAPAPSDDEEIGRPTVFDLLFGVSYPTRTRRNS